MSTQPPPAPIASAVGPCPTMIQISRTPQHWKFTQHHRTTRPPPYCLKGPWVVGWCWVNFQCRGVLLLWIVVGQGLTALPVGAGGGCSAIFTLIYPFSSLSPSLWETARYRLKYCFKGPCPTFIQISRINSVRQYFSLYRAVSQRKGWLVGCFGFNGPLRQHFSLYRAVSQREGERG